jgi:hypothetical protein
MNPTLALTRDLIACPSVTPTDAGCLDMIAARLAPLGFECVRLPSNDVDNLWAVRGAHGPCLAFAGHTRRGAARGRWTPGRAHPSNPRWWTASCGGAVRPT